MNAAQQTAPATVSTPHSKVLWTSPADRYGYTQSAVFCRPCLGKRLQSHGLRVVDGERADAADSDIACEECAR